MRSTTTIRLISFLFLSNAFTLTSSYALSRTLIRADGNYQRTESQYVMMTSHLVEVMCDPGDVPMKGTCGSENRVQFSEEREHGIIFDSAEATVDEKRGFSCRARRIDAQQLIRVDATVFCKKPEKSS